MKRPLQSQAMRGRSFARTYSITRAARIAGVTVAQLEAAIQRGELPVTFIPRRAVDIEAFGAWMRQQLVSEAEVL